VGSPFDPSFQFLSPFSRIQFPSKVWRGRHSFQKKKIQMYSTAKKIARNVKFCKNMSKSRFLTDWTYDGFFFYLRLSSLLLPTYVDASWSTCNKNIILQVKYVSWSPNIYGRLQAKIHEPGSKNKTPFGHCNARPKLAHLRKMYLKCFSNLTTKAVIELRATPQLNVLRTELWGLESID
jgi:hypothetical protein